MQGRRKVRKVGTPRHGSRHNTLPPHHTALLSGLSALDQHHATTTTERTRSKPKQVQANQQAQRAAGSASSLHMMQAKLKTGARWTAPTTAISQASAQLTTARQATQQAQGCCACRTCRIPHLLAGTQLTRLACSAASHESCNNSATPQLPKSQPVCHKDSCSTCTVAGLFPSFQKNDHPTNYA
jgi:hypothetical protein